MDCKKHLKPEKAFNIISILKKSGELIKVWKPNVKP